MPTHKVKLIVNPYADLGRALQRAADIRPIVEEFGGADWSGTVYPTHAVELARQAGLDGYQTVVAVGGDGTVHEVMNGLMLLPPEQRPILGVVPLGSGNDFAHATGINSDPAIAMRQALTGSSKKIDIGRLKDGRGRIEYWDNSVGIGFDTTVTIRSRRFTKTRGFMIYLIAVIQTILLNHAAVHLKVTSDEGEWEDDMLLFTLCNGPREGGGFLLAPDARSDDGIFQYSGVRKVSRPMMFRLLPEVMKGTHGRFPQVRMGQFKQMQITADQALYIHTDGEIFSGFGVDVRRIELEILPAALKVMI
jgi:YegS/Rv2252/BmrU family lipid kinase